MIVYIYNVFYNNKRLYNKRNVIIFFISNIIDNVYIFICFFFGLDFKGIVIRVVIIEILIDLFLRYKFRIFCFIEKS